MIKYYQKIVQRLKMVTVGIKDLQINPAKLTRALENNQYTMITKRSKPLGVAIAFNDAIMIEGLQKALVIDAYEKGDLSLGQLCTTLKIDKEKAMKMLSMMGVDVIAYDFEEEKKVLDSFL